MPVPAEQMRSLDEALRDHELRIEALTASLRAIEDEVRVHRMVVTLGRNHEVRAALEKIYDDAELRRRISEDPAGFLRRSGVELNDTDVELRVGDPDDEMIFEARFRQGPLRYAVEWTRTDGFLLTGT